MTTTPVTSAGLRKYDALPAEEAVRKAWNDPGRNAYHHRMVQEEIRRSMPLLARALDRL